MVEDKITNEGQQIEFLTVCSLNQLISDPTHILPISSPCTDLPFTDQ